MNGAWAGKYLAVPWLDRGRTLSGCDCWGLVRLVLHEEAGRELPDYADLYRSTDDTAGLERLFLDRWPLEGVEQVVGEPREFDIVLLRIAGQGCHVGVSLGDGRFLHVTPGSTGPTVERLTSPRWAPRLLGVYRHV